MLKNNVFVLNFASNSVKLADMSKILQQTYEESIMSRTHEDDPQGHGFSVAV